MIRLIQRHCWMALALVLAGIAMFAAPATAADRPNIVFVLADDLGWTELGCYGNTFNETPNIDRLAREGMRLTQAYAAAPVCSPYRAALLMVRIDVGSVHVVWSSGGSCGVLESAARLVGLRAIEGASAPPRERVVLTGRTRLPCYYQSCERSRCRQGLVDALDGSTEDHSSYSTHHNGGHVA